MKIAHARMLFLTSVLLFGFSTAIAQGSSSDEADVWIVIEAEWNAAEKGDKKWPDRLLTDNFTGWPNNSPAPRSKSSIRMWNDFNSKTGKMIKHELYPLSIVVHENVAVAHYLYTAATELPDESIEMSNGRYTDVLVRTDDGWKFLSWHGGDDE